MHYMSHDQGGLHSGDLCPEEESTSRGLGRPPPPRDTWDTMGYVQQMGGMHPVGMHSFSFSSGSTFVVRYT